jgi:hypothetical protein
VKRTPLKRGKPPQRKTRVKARNAKRKGHRFPKRRQPACLEWVREMPCCNCGWPGPSHPHHVKTRGAGGPDVGNLVPLCPFCHSELHTMGRRSFALMYEIDLAAIARNLGERYTPTEAAW